MADEGKYVEINFKELCSLLKISNDNIEIVEQLKIEYSQNKDASRSSKQTLYDIISIRQQLLENVTKCEGEISTTQCPFCGFDWKSAHILIQNIELTSKRLSNLVSGTEKRCIEINNELKNVYNDQYLNKLQKQIEIYTNDTLLMEFARLYSKDSLQKYENLKALMNKIGIDYMNYSYDIKNIKDIVNNIKKDINYKIVLLPPEYENEKSTYQYSKIIDIYFNSIQDVENLKIDDVDKKISYIHYKFYSEQNELSLKITNLTELHKRLLNEVKKEINEYLESWKRSISRYYG